MIANDLMEKRVSNRKLMMVMENCFNEDVDPLNDGMRIIYQKGFIRGIQKTPRIFSNDDLRFIRDSLVHLRDLNPNDKINILLNKIGNILANGDLKAK